MSGVISCLLLFYMTIMMKESRVFLGVTEKCIKPIQFGISFRELKPTHGTNPFLRFEFNVLKLSAVSWLVSLQISQFLGELSAQCPENSFVAFSGIGQCLDHAIKQRFEQVFSLIFS